MAATRGPAALEQRPRPEPLAHRDRRDQDDARSRGEQGRQRQQIDQRAVPGPVPPAIMTIMIIGTSTRLRHRTNR